jgi:hypothetical protein
MIILVAKKRNLLEAIIPNISLAKKIKYVE